MREAPRQLALDLPVESRSGAEDFLVGPSNRDAHGLVERWPGWPAPWLLLLGPEGAGKSHLAAIWAGRAAATILPAGAVRQDALPDLLQRDALVLEDCDRAALDEPALFHLLNAAKARGGSLLLTARTSPESWGLSVPDLVSRLRLAPQAAIAAPDDALLRAVLVKQFVDRQLLVDSGVIDTLMLHMERSFAAAGVVIARLDRLSLERGRRVTRAMALEVASAFEAPELPLE